MKREASDAKILSPADKLFSQLIVVMVFEKDFETMGDVFKLQEEYHKRKEGKGE